MSKVGFAFRKMSAGTSREARTSLQRNSLVDDVDRRTLTLEPIEVAGVWPTVLRGTAGARGLLMDVPHDHARVTGGHRAARRGKCGVGRRGNETPSGRWVRRHEGVWACPCARGLGAPYKCSAQHRHRRVPHQRSHRASYRLHGGKAKGWSWRGRADYLPIRKSKPCTKARRSRASASCPTASSGR